MRCIASVFLVCASLASAQTFSFGVKGGGFFTNPAERLDQSRKYVVGPSAEVGFANRFGVEVDALYSRFGAAGLPGSVRGNSFEFPVLGKYYFSGKGSAVRPFAGAGFAFRNIWMEEEGRSNRLGRGVNSTDPATGAVFGAGATFGAWRLKLTPEVRYTRWGGYNYPATNPNQVQALIGITF